MIRFPNEEYSWENMSLQQYLEEGNYPSCWSGFFQSLEVETAIKRVSDRLDATRTTKKIYPPIHQVFRAFYATPPEKADIVLLGMDPYHNGSAIGLCFSVKPGNKANPSLRNIYTQLKKEEFKPVEDGNLLHWARSVLMINTALTVEQGVAGSHTQIWKEFTNLLVSYIRSEKRAWILFGNHAQAFDTGDDVKFCTSHPSPFSYMKATKTAPAFIGSMVFTNVNKYLIDNGKNQVDW